MISKREEQHFQSTLHTRWQRHSYRRQQVPGGETGRACLGLAALFRHVDEGQVHGERVLYPADGVMWLCLRDVPPGYFPRCRRLNHGMSYASRAMGKLRYGMPSLNFAEADFARVDFQQMRLWPFAVMPDAWRNGKMYQVGDVPDGSTQAREFAVLNRVSAEMTRTASYGLDDQRRPLMRNWFNRRSMGGRPFQVCDSRQWMPRPFLAFRERDVQSLNQRAVKTIGVEPALRSMFTTAVAEGLTLRTTCRSIYLGSEAAVVGGQSIRHRFCDRAGTERAFFLPAKAVILARAGTELKPGQKWATALPQLPKLWFAGNSRQRALAITEACGDSLSMEQLRLAWFQSQGLHLSAAPDLVLYPLDFAIAIAREIPPCSLWWDFGNADSYITNEHDLDAAIFPALPLQRCNALRFDLCGVDVNAGIDDLRFHGSPQHLHPKKADFRSVYKSRSGRRFPYKEHCESVVPSPSRRAV